MDDLNDTQKRTLAAQINGIKNFVLKYRSNTRLVEANEVGFLKVFEEDVKKTRAEVERAQRVHEVAVAKLSAKRQETQNIVVWLEENKDKFEKCESMLSDEMQELAKQLNKLVQ